MLRKSKITKMQDDEHSKVAIQKGFLEIKNLGYTASLSYLKSFEYDVIRTDAEGYRYRFAIASFGSDSKVAIVSTGPSPNDHTPWVPYRADIKLCSDNVLTIKRQSCPIITWYVVKNEPTATSIWGKPDFLKKLGW